MAGVVKGRINWTLQRDKEGHRTYKIRWLVLTTSTADGPASVHVAAGLPGIGSSWIFGWDNDPWARCWPTMSVKPVITREPGWWWEVEQTFTTKPLSRCQDDSIENPLAEPPKISGSFVKYTKEVHKDRHGFSVDSSSHELFRGAAVEFDDNRPTVSISMNVATLPLSLFAPMIDTVNDGGMWGLGTRRVKLSNASWERLLWGTCSFYYTVNYEFDINDGPNGFDRKIIDEGTKVLIPGGNVNNPNDFEAYKDINGENSRVLLGGNGKALTDGQNPHEFLLEYYDESNFFALGIPSSF